MFQPLVKLLLSKLDLVVDAYLDRQQFVNLIAIPGTLLFLFVFWALSGAGGAMLVLGLFLMIIELGLAGGLYVLKEKYEDEIRQSNDVADAIDAYLCGSDVFGEWKQFLETPLTQPELEEIRDHCARLPQDFPPEGPAEYCNEQGVAILESYASELRVGIVTKFHRDFTVWRAMRRAAKAEKKGREADALEEITLRTNPGAVRQKQVAASVRHVPTLNPSAFLDESTQKQVDKEAAKEAKRAIAEAKKDAKRAEKAASKATKKAIAAEKKHRRKAPPEMPELPDEAMYYHHEATTFAPAPAPPQPVAEPDVEPAPPPPPPPAAPSKKRGAGGLTEAGAIQEVMRAGYTAHHYDQAQQTLTRRLGREPAPQEVVKALVANAWGKGKKSKGKKSKAKKRSQIKRTTRTAAHKSVMVPVVQDDHRPRRSRIGWMKFVVLLGLVGAVPFGMWRLEKPKSGPVIITGQVYHQVLDMAPDIQHKMRTPFEEFVYGNRAITIVDGPRIYVSPEDYELCWPEPWEDIYEKGYSIMITAEAKPLMVGGYSVARITDHKRVDREIASADQGSRRRRTGSR